MPENAHPFVHGPLLQVRICEGRPLLVVEQLGGGALLLPPSQRLHLGPRLVRQPGLTAGVMTPQ
jgi:hypothetical protein